MASTDEPLRPIPAETTAPGDPDGHHEIPEPNFTATAPCRGCSPVIEITATGWGEWPTLWPSQPAAEHAETTQRPPQATITAGPSNIIVTQQPSSQGGGFVIGGSTTVKPGQTVIIDNTPIVIQTSAGRTEVIVGTKTVPFQAPAAQPPNSQITDGPILLPIIIGNGQTLTPIANPAANPSSKLDSNPDSNSNPNPNNQNPNQLSDPPGTGNAFPSQYVIGGQTLTPGGPAITVSGTTLSLAPSATAIVVNGKTTTLSQAYGAIYTTTALPALTLWGEIYTANRAGYYILHPGTTLIPGGLPITVSGTVLSLEPRGTAIMIQGSTSYMQPVTTIVTLTKSGAEGYGGGAGLYTNTGVPGTLPYPTGKPNAGVSVRAPAAMTDGWLSGIFLLGFVGLGWLAVWL